MILLQRKSECRISIVEVGPRDGLQNEKNILSTEDKIDYIQGLISAGVKRIEVTSFVRGDKIPQMKDAEQLLPKLLTWQEKAQLICLIPNRQGMEKALNCGLNKKNQVAIFTAASETFNKKNTNATIEESFKRMAEVCSLSQKNGISVRGYISTAFVCPYEGIISLDKVLDLAKKLLDLGVDEISLGDTIGLATPIMVEQLIDGMSHFCEHSKMALHFHDTYGFALANIYTGYKKGVRIFDSSSGGLGGCPYAKGATGNVATEDVVNLMHKLNVNTGIDLSQLSAVSLKILQKLNKVSPAKYLATLTSTQY